MIELMCCHNNQNGIIEFIIQRAFKMVYISAGVVPLPENGGSRHLVCLPHLLGYPDKL